MHLDSNKTVKLDDSTRRVLYLGDAVSLLAAKLASECEKLREVLKEADRLKMLPSGEVFVAELSSASLELVGAVSELEGKLLKLREHNDRPVTT